MGTFLRGGLSRGALLCLFASASCDSCGEDRDETSGDAGDGLAPSDGGADSRVGDGAVVGTACTPFAQTCQGGRATYCREDGTRVDYECDPDQGLTCTATGCRGACDLSNVIESYIGCDYYPTVTLNPVWSGFSFAVAVSNTSSQVAHVKITRGATVVQEADVPANQLSTFDLPWVSELKGGDISCIVPPGRGDSRLVADGAYRVRSNQPVTVYQFSPLQYEIKPAPALCPTTTAQCPDSQVTQCFAYSNDASLLLPATALTGNYTILSWPSQSAGAGFVAVTATQDDTQVQVHGTGMLASGAGVSSTGGIVTLKRGGVLELVAAAEGDISGTRIRANKPVQVLSGHSCAYVPTEAAAPTCDHLEEVVFPEDTLGKQYVLTTPLYADGITPTPYVLRVAATADDTRVTFDPKIEPDAVLKAGQFLEVSVTGPTPPNVLVSSDKPVLVATYMVGQKALPFANGVAGDPSLSTGVPIEQYRSEYLFTAPTTYDVNIASIIAKKGAVVRVDGRTLPASDFVGVGASEYGVANVVLENSSVSHSVSANQKVGLTVYGYGQFTSYMYPGGADLARIAFPIAI